MLAAVPACEHIGEDVLVTLPAERILLFARLSSEQRYGEGIDADVLQERFGLPVERAE